VTAPSSTAELLVRGAVIGILVLISVRIGAGARAPARLTGAAFSLAGAAHAATQFPPILQALGPAAVLAWVLSVMGTGLFWAFALELFGDRERLQPVRLLPAIALLGIGIMARLSPAPVAWSLWLAHNLLGAALMVHVLVVIWTGWRGDLVEARRRLRGPLLALAATYALAVAIVQTAELYMGPATPLSFLAAVSLLVLSLASGVVFLREDSQLFGSAAPRGGQRRVPPRDESLAQRLNQALDRDEVWREEGLTIGGLAQRLGAPEHHLRRLINEGLGYRNFAAFLNERRIAAAKAALADPANARTPVSKIAYEVGFNSLAPFNRAFRELSGQAPTAWRLAKLSSISADPP
jgi:AraC-like DNA-binding protein